MSGFKGRVARLEARRRPVSHFVSVARVPWPLGAPDEWRQGLRCPCGRRGCPELRVGLLVPQKAPSAEAWAATARQYEEGRGDG